MKLVKGSLKAKQYMAKIRAKKTITKKKIGSVKASKELKKDLKAKNLFLPHGYETKRRKRKIGEVHTDTKSHNVKIDIMSGIDDKLNFNQKVGIIYGEMKRVQNKIINREKLTDFDEKLFYYVSKYGFVNGSKKAVKDKLI